MTSGKSVLDLREAGNVGLRRLNLLPQRLEQRIPVSYVPGPGTEWRIGVIRARIAADLHTTIFNVSYATAICHRAV